MVDFETKIKEVFEKHNLNLKDKEIKSLYIDVVRIFCTYPYSEFSDNDWIDIAN